MVWGGWLKVPDARGHVSLSNNVHVPEVHCHVKDRPIASLPSLPCPPRLEALHIGQQLPVGSSFPLPSDILLQPAAEDSPYGSFRSCLALQQVKRGPLQEIAHQQETWGPGPSYCALS